LHDVGALFGKQAGKLRLLARFQDQDAIAAEPVSHDRAFSTSWPSFVHPCSQPRLGARAAAVIEQGAPNAILLKAFQAASCPIINMC